MLVKAMVCLDKFIIGVGTVAITGIIGVIAQRVIVDSFDEAFTACVDRFKGEKSEEE